MAGIKFGPSSEDDAKPIPEVEAVRDPDSLKQKKKLNDMRRKGIVLCSHPLLRIVGRERRIPFSSDEEKKMWQRVLHGARTLIQSYASVCIRKQSPRIAKTKRFKKV